MRTRTITFWIGDPAYTPIHMVPMDVDLDALSPAARALAERITTTVRQDALRCRSRITNAERIAKQIRARPFSNGFVQFDDYRVTPEEIEAEIADYIADRERMYGDTLVSKIIPMPFDSIRGYHHWEDHPGERSGASESPEQYLERIIRELDQHEYDVIDDDPLPPARYASADVSRALGVDLRYVSVLAKRLNVGRRDGKDWTFSPEDIETMRQRTDRRRRTRQRPG